MIPSEIYSSNSNDEPFCIRLLIYLFRKLGEQITFHPWSFIITTIVVTAMCSSSIPLTKITNDVTDYTPYAARAREELEVAYEAFFSRKGQPILILIFITAKNGQSMLNIPQLNDTVRILDHAVNDIFLHNKHTNQSLSYNQLCTNFCDLNEPVRNFYYGLKISKSHNNTPLAIDLSFPVTTVLGMNFRVDNNFYGVKAEIERENGRKEIITLKELKSVKGRTIFDDERAKIKNNLRDIRMVLLQFRANKPADALQNEIERFELDVVEYFKKYIVTTNFSSEYVDVVIMTPLFATAEIVRSGLLLFPYVILGFIIMCIFSTFTTTISALLMSQMNLSKIAIAIMACVCPMMACGTGLGLLFWFGLRFGSTLCVTPFLVLAIGVDDAFLMINSWQRNKSLRSSFPYSISDFKENSSTNKLKARICTMLEDIGPSVTITTLTNVLAFGIGSLTPTPEIQLFCLGNAVTMTMDFIYQITFFTAIMVVAGKYEMTYEGKASIKSQNHSKENSLKSLLVNTFKSLVEKYCDILCSKLVTFVVILSLIIYWCISIYGAKNMTAELRPERLLVQDSDMVKAEDFESLPSSLGRFASNFWLRDFEEFIRVSDRSIDENQNNITSISTVTNELRYFLEWPEFRHWKGFLDLSTDENGQIILNKFFFTISSHGEELKQWSNRAILLQKLREVADNYSFFEVSIYDDDAKFLDLIGTLVVQTLQSSICTFVCMMFVCLLFIKRTSGAIIATFSIISTCLGIYGFLSIWDVNLDPIVMSAMIMSIGFSVDIPAHVTYHYYQRPLPSPKIRLYHCMCTIAFPILQAALSSLFCVLSVTYVELYMGKVFAKTMILIVTIGLAHGLIIIPTLFNALHLLQSFRAKKHNTIYDQSSLKTPPISAITIRTSGIHT
ncbi:unnamed protein product [Dracunculus medinensis]|uniref:SSD domain-containing protein n=1 Tax=Dracunculus medinensis TaxID=318479 RepID=A0A0N4U386_DRAME|nr:unnamed protein product [Dracunculus medinensis]